MSAQDISYKTLLLFADAYFLKISILVYMRENRDFKTGSYRRDQAQGGALPQGCGSFFFYEQQDDQNKSNVVYFKSVVINNSHNGFIV